MGKKNIFIKVLLFLLIVDIIRTEGSAQTKNLAVTGIIQDKLSKQPIEFASLQLLHPGDSSAIKMTVTDSKGKFILNDIAAGNYILNCSFIGYEKIIMPITINQKKE